MKTALKFAGISLLVLAGYLLFWPVPVEPVSWAAPQSRGYTGAFQANSKLVGLETIAIPGDDGPEDMAEGPDGLIYFSTHGGKIMRFNPADETMSEFASTGGRPLGLEFDADGTLYVADAFRGLLEIDASGAVRLLTDHVAKGDPILYADDLDIDAGGRIYVSDASTKFGAKASGGTLAGSLLELMEHGKTGRLLKYDPASGETTIVKDNMSFPNGVAMCPDSRCLMLAETGTYQIHKVWLDEARYGQSDIIIENIPGFPDNINDTFEGEFWAGMTSPRSKPLDDMSESPFLRKVVQRLPAALRPKAESYGFVIKFNEDGDILENLQDPAGTYPLTTGATEAGGRLYISSLTADEIAWLER